MAYSGYLLNGSYCYYRKTFFNAFKMWKVGKRGRICTAFCAQAWKISDDSTSGKLVNSVGRKKGETRRGI